VQKVGDGEVASVQQKLASLSIKDAPVIGSFNPAKGSIVLAQFSLDNSWNRAMVGTLYVDPLLPNSQMQLVSTLTNILMLNICR
jgi:hypothetical protein